MNSERKDNNYLFDSGNLSEGALAKKHRIETDPSARTNIMDYLPGMEVIQSDIADKVLSESENYDYSKYTGKDVKRALEHERCTLEDFKALLSPAAAPYLEQMAAKAKIETSKHFGNNVYFFHAALHCELLRKLLRLLRVQLLQPHQAHAAYDGAD
jgi:hypothetical protein